MVKQTEGKDLGVISVQPGAKAMKMVKMAKMPCEGERTRRMDIG